MSNNVSQKTARININNAGYCVVNTNTTSEYTASTKKALPGIMTIDITPKLATGTLYGDGVVTSDIAKVTGATVKIGLNKVPIEDRAIMLGQTYADGVLSAKSSDISPDIAFYFELPSDNGTKEQMWLYCGKAQQYGLSGKQIEGSITFTTDEITIEFRPRDLDQKLYDLADTANADFTSSASTTFASAPPTTA